jgi:hypothetical protein
MTTPRTSSRRGSRFSPLSSSRADTGLAMTKSPVRVDDLQDVGTTIGLAQSDLDALQTVGEWIKAFIAKPHGDLGRAGPVCPFVPVGLERKTLWLAPERVGGRSVPEVVDVVRGYQRLFLETEPTDGDDSIYRAIVVVFTDLQSDRAGDFFQEVLNDLAVPSYVSDAFVMGGFCEGNAGGAIYNSSFRPFTSPVPFLLMRQGVIEDWKFFLDDDVWLGLWAQRHGGSGGQALGKELRRLPWRSHR